MIEFNNKSRPKIKEGKAEKRDFFDSVNALYKGRELTLTAFKSWIFTIEATQYEGVKILTPKKTLERLSIVFVQKQVTHLKIY